MTALVSPTDLDLDLVERACGHRHGVVLPPVAIPVTAADPAAVHHASVAFEGQEFQSAGGGVAVEPAAAQVAAVGEALERYAATHATLPIRRRTELGTDHAIALDEFSLHAAHQIADPRFPHRSAYPHDPWMTEAFDLRTNASVWVPAALVSLTPDYGALATSSGLAADPDPARALLRALQELIERDAFMTTWMHQLGGRLVWRGPADDRCGGELRIFDLTPQYSPHPVAAVTGTLWLEGRPRHSIGLACRQQWADAVERARLEFFQGTVFVGHLLHRAPELHGIPPELVTGFDEHAVFYAANPTWWEALPLHRDATPSAEPAGIDPAPAPRALERLVHHVVDRGVRLAYRELTTVDLNQLGLHVVRVLSPDLTPIHHDHRWPFLGGGASDLGFRYPDGIERTGGRPFPSPFPHALG